MRDYASLYQSLLDDLDLTGDEDFSHIFSDMGRVDVAKRSLASSFYKKLIVGAGGHKADVTAQAKFLTVNNHLKAFHPDFQPNSEVESCFHDYFKDNLRLCLEQPLGLSPSDHAGFDMEFIRSSMAPGPGSAQKADSSTMITKLFQSPLSYYCPRNLALYRTALAVPGIYADAEMHRNKVYGNVKVEGVKIFYAVKNAEISRVCGTEASVEMLIQKALGLYFEGCLERHFGINLSEQPDINRRLAREGSIHGTFGTMDLVSASDHVGVRLIERDFPDNFIKSCLLNLRAKVAIFPDGTKEDLAMISTMGNGFTFPLQTLIFACAIKAVYHLMGIPLIGADKSRTFSVFGDDIIVRSDAFEFLAKMLQKLGFEVNVGKSFNVGSFRESCGHDYFNGFDVRGVYIRSLETPQLVYSAFNRLASWSARQGVWLPNVMRSLKLWARDIRVPPSESDDAGFHVPFKLTKPKVDSRYWFQYRFYRRKVKKHKVVESDDGHVTHLCDALGFLSGVYRRRDYVLLTESDSPWKHEHSISVSIRDRIGARARYQIAQCSIPFWDFLPSQLTKRVGPDGWDSGRMPVTRHNQPAWESGLVALQVFDL